MTAEEILKSEATLKRFIFGLGDRYEHWTTEPRALIYRSYGYEEIYSEPDWEKVRLDLIERGVDTPDRIEEQFSEAIYKYRVCTRG
jgi:hypothetical protein